MEVEEVWRAVRRERLGVAAMLEQLSPQEWREPSLCAGWTVREVAAHLTMQDRIGPLSPLREVIRARGNFNRMADQTARRLARQPTAKLVSDLRDLAESRRMGFTMRPAEALLDMLTHSQDIALPLGRVYPLPIEASRVAAERVWGMTFPFLARWRLRGFRLVATDIEWSRGRGAEVRGPIGAMLLLLAGRRASLSQLSGTGAAALAARLG
ncbi:uncharacterized protein (TIGR03083 family) [Allocatelliglobosispora scoriae]|uniref:Uncharacterized protein (TIGR03083 family) n=1 Tax=Allocatelliglobosispora scoriae TaxID=643052 RepID=A0A841C1Z2_9ACTN|nr:maleylpyruvate isomerase family mycothiol-dependent enzyme [Allocatelliglobosispora scoriae]MBB5872990.1 uncharacterized protein (TIGR03083 family) [Allocatelliglobosispora scoriae]